MTIGFSRSSLLPATADLLGTTKLLTTASRFSCRMEPSNLRSPWSSALSFRFYSKSDDDLPAGRDAFFVEGGFDAIQVARPLETGNHVSAAHHGLDAHADYTPGRTRDS